MISTPRFAMVVLLLQGIVAAPDVAAQDAKEVGTYISVTGVGKVSAMPDAMELVGTVCGDGELAGDALTQFLAVAKETIDRLESLGIDGMAVTTRGLTVGQASLGTSTAERLMAARNGRPPEAAKVRFSERVHICINGIDKLNRDELLSTIVKIIDAGNEAGLTFGKTKSEMEIIRSDSASDYVLFRLVNTADAQARARELAMQEARSNAEKLAGLAGATLGRVVSLDEMNISTYVPSSMRAEPNTTTTRDTIEVSASIRVRFEISTDSP